MTNTLPVSILADSGLELNRTGEPTMNTTMLSQRFLFNGDPNEAYKLVDLSGIKILLNPSETEAYVIGDNVHNIQPIPVVHGEDSNLQNFPLQFENNLSFQTSSLNFQSGPIIFGDSILLNSNNTVKPVNVENITIKFNSLELTKPHLQEPEELDKELDEILSLVNEDMRKESLENFRSYSTTLQPPTSFHDRAPSLSASSTSPQKVPPNDILSSSPQTTKPVLPSTSATCDILPSSAASICDTLPKIPRRSIPSICVDDDDDRLPKSARTLAPPTCDDTLRKLPQTVRPSPVTLTLSSLSCSPSPRSCDPRLPTLDVVSSPPPVEASQMEEFEKILAELRSCLNSTSRVLKTTNENVPVETREKIFENVKQEIEETTKKSDCPSANDVSGGAVSGFEKHEDGSQEKSSPERPVVYACNICGQIFDRMTSYNGHLNQHTGQIAWKCSHCTEPLTFRTQTLLKQHVRVHHGAERLFQCDLCSDAFVFPSHLMSHLRSVHRCEKEYICRMCSRSFFKKCDLRRHLQIHLSLKAFLCDICGKRFAQSSNLVAHKRSHTGSRPYPCVHCGKRFKQINALNIHKENKHADVETSSSGGEDVERRKKNFYCLVCGVTFKYQALLREHTVTLHEKQKLFQCSECVQIYHNVYGFLEHSCISGSDDRTSSTLTNENNEELLHLLNEILTNTDSTNRNEEFMNILMDLNVAPPVMTTPHEQESSQEEREKIEMDMMPSEMSAEQIFNNLAPSTLVVPPRASADSPIVLSPTSLSQIISQFEVTLKNVEKMKKFVRTERGHQQLDKIIEKLKENVGEDGRHRAISPPPNLTSSKTRTEFVCNVCNAKFTRSHSYKVHMRSKHSVDKPAFVCHLCCKQFTFETGLKTHMRNLHPKQGERTTFPCECGRVYHTKHKLGLHIKRDHENEKPHACEQCGKSFFSKSDLKTHYRVHTGEKPYVCDVCQMAFGHSSHLFRHKRSVHRVTKEKE